MPPARASEEEWRMLDTHYPRAILLTAALKCLSDSIAQKVATTIVGQAFLCLLTSGMISAKISRLTRDSLRHIQMNYLH